MQRVKRSTAVAVLPVPPAGGTPGYFAAPNPAAGVAATQPGYEWFNSVQEEMVNMISAAGIELSDADQSQLLKAVVQRGIQGCYFNAAVGAGNGDAINCAFVPAIDTLRNGMVLWVRAPGANAGTTPTFTPAVGTIPAKTIVKGAGAALAPSDIIGAGHWIGLQYDALSDKWGLLNPSYGVDTVSPANDPSYSNNTTKPASTSWVRGALTSLASAAGFVCALGANGYIKFPSWLGSWIVQWAAGASTAVSGNVVITLPIAFPVAHLRTVVGNLYAKTAVPTNGCLSPTCPSRRTRPFFSAATTRSLILMIET